jgi:hypothetical protein
MKKSFVFTTAKLFILVSTTAVALSFSTFMIPFAATAQQQQQQTSPSLSLRDIFKQVQNSTVQITSNITAINNDLYRK